MCSEQDSESWGEASPKEHELAEEDHSLLKSRSLQEETCQRVIQNLPCFCLLEADWGIPTEGH